MLFGRRRVVDVTVSEGWVAIVTVESDSTDSSAVSVYHLKSGRRGLFRASICCFRPGAKLLLSMAARPEVSRDEGGGGERGCCSVISMIDLEQLPLETPASLPTGGAAVTTQLQCIDVAGGTGGAVRWNTEIQSEDSSQAEVTFIATLAEYIFVIHRDTMVGAHDRDETDSSFSVSVVSASTGRVLLRSSISRPAAAAPKSTLTMVTAHLDLISHPQVCI